MRFRFWMLSIVFLSFLFSGCTAMENRKYGSEAFFAGFEQDMDNTWQNIKDADLWMRENMW